MIFNFIKIRFIQVLLNLKKNLKYFNIIFLFFLFFSSTTVFGFWNLLSGYYHIVSLVFFSIIILSFFKFNKKYFKFVSLKYSVNWLEEKNFKNINPLTAVRDKPADLSHSKLLWDAHIKQSKSQIKKTIYYTPKISFNSVDPLKLRFLFILFFTVSLFWGYNNNTIERNIYKIFQVSFKKTNLDKENFKIVTWVEPPYYTRFPQTNIDLEKLKDKTISVPISSELAIQTTGLGDRKIKVIIDENKIYNKANANKNLNIKHIIKKKKMLIL